MNTVQLIKKKRDGGSLSQEELRFLIEGFTKGEIPDYQMSAFLMAVYFRGMTADESKELVSLMVNSGKTVDLSRLEQPPPRPGASKRLEDVGILTAGLEMRSRLWRYDARAAVLPPQG